MKKILTILICVVLGVVNVFAKSTIKVKFGVRYCHNNTFVTGGGKIYTSTFSNGDLDVDAFVQNNPVKEWTAEYSPYDTEREITISGSTKNFTLLYAKPDYGNYFVGWSTKSNAENYSNHSLWEATDSVIYYGGSTLSNLSGQNSGNVERYAIFKPAACYYDILEAEVVFVDANGKILDNFNPDPSQYQIKIDDGAWVNKIVDNDPKLVSCRMFPGNFGRHTYAVSSPDGDKAYEFVGWFKDLDGSSIYDENGNIDSEKQLEDADGNPKTYQSAEQETSLFYHDYKDSPADAPRVPKVYAVFKSSSSSIALYRYNAEIDKFNEAMPPVEHNEGEWVKYVDVPYATNETLYKLEHTFGEQLKIESNDDFVGTLDKVQGLDILRVNPILEGDLSGVITFVVGETTIAKLHLSASSDNNYPSITLKPAADLMGTYTYTQQSSAGTEFSVTTSEVVKVLKKETDKMFTFKPYPTDPNKAVFEKWVIEKDGIKYEDTRTTFPYRFEGGESIMPVFRSTEFATFIILSQPDIHYYDLQEALKVAAELPSPETQIVSVYAPTATTKRLKYREDGYEITNGVTLLIPGDAAYSNIMGDVSTSDFLSVSEPITPSCYCQLNVDDNTQITVKQGNISIYSKLISFQYDNGGRIRYGQLHLGKNCNITVEKGGLYAFGFITGDKSSQVIMGSETTTYEVFNYKDMRKLTNVLDMYNKRKTYKVFPIGQYYIQSVEVPLTFTPGATEYVSSVIYVGNSWVPMNLPFIGKDDASLFNISNNVNLTKTYDPTSDRLKLEFVGNQKESSVNIGSMYEKLSTLELKSSEYVLPIQNNMDIEVKNTTINVTSDIALMPSAKLFVHETAKINIDANVNMYVYDYGAHKLHNCGCTGGYWGPLNNVVLPLKYKNNCPRPGDVHYRNTLGDASLVLDGVMDIRGALYTVRGEFTTAADPNGGANITSNGSGKINVYKIGDDEKTYQYHVNYDCNKDDGFYSLPLTSPNLLLHNNETINKDKPYTSVTKPGIYTYYQSDGMWRHEEDKLPISGIKLYDSNDKEINQFYVTMPTPTTINGYILASLENIGVTYNHIDFDVALSDGNIKLNSNIAPYVDGDKLRIPVIYNVKNVHGSTTQTLTITNKNSAAFTCNFSAPVKAQENYTPVFSVPSTVNIYARVGEPTYAASPIQCSMDNVASLIKSVNSGDTKWTTTFKEGNTTFDESEFIFELGQKEGQELSGARIKYTPKDDIRRTVTLTLKATYRDNEQDVNCCGQTILREHQVVINTYPSMVANTMEFNEVGTLLPGKEFELLRFVNSDVKPQLFINDTEVTGDSFRDNVFSVGYNGGDASLSKPNYSVTVEGTGTVKVRVHQEANNGIEAKTIEKTFVVTSNPPALEEGICVSGDDASTIFYGLTSAVENAVQCSEGCITFAKSASWTAQFEGVAGNISFTPSGDGYWAVEESQGHGYNWEQTSIYWTKLTPRQRIVVNLQPQTRLIKISYSDNNPETENGGSITDFCINPLSIYAEIDHLYIPIKEGVVDPIFIDFTHSTPLLESAFAINKPDNWIQEVIARTKDDEANGNLNWGGDLNVYYKTRVKLSPKEGVSISEAKNVVAVTATKSQAESATVNVSTYDFPKSLPIYSTTWTQTAGDNGYLKSEYYYHYMVESSYVKWDEANQDVIFLNKGNDTDAKRQVVFGFDGMPDEVRFQSESNEWLVEESENGNWSAESPTTSNVSTKTVGETQYWYKEISQTAQYVRITYLGDAMDEIVLNDLVIEGLPTAVARESGQSNSAEVTEIILPDANSNKTATFYIHVKNLENLQLAMENSSGFTFKHGSNTVNFVNGIAAITGYDFLAVNKDGVIPVTVTWNAEHIVDEGYLRIQKPSANPAEPAQDLHVIHIVAKKDVVTQSDSKTGIWTGVPDGQAENRPTEQAYQLRGLNDTYDPYRYHEVNVANAFDKNGYALFNYLVIYGETTTTDGSSIIYEADGSRGSNALTPYYIYERISDTEYQLKQTVENANSPTKAVLDQVSHHVGIKGENEQMYYAIQPNDNDSVSFYMTGFCPYASTGSTMHDEGVWYFRGPAGSRVDVYLEDCHIYSRNKSIEGQKHSKNDAEAPDFTGGVVRGSGAVLVFENTIADLNNPPAGTFDVAIHTIGHNILKSNYGAYYNPLGTGTVRAAQVSASIQVRLAERDHLKVARTVLDFDDKWPTATTKENGVFKETKRTNGFLSLQKQANHAPSIDLGTPTTVVNFRGGRVELQNAEIVSPNYKTTLAISHRSGIMGNIKDFPFAYGIGTDDVGGTVNFYDGTTTVIDLWVEDVYKDFYLIDKNGDEEIYRDVTKNGREYREYKTTCLRTPTNTFIYGGSHCMLRACKYVTSRGGAPTDGAGNFLGLYKYPSASWSETIDGETVTHKGGWTEINGGNGRVTIDDPDNLPNPNYGTESITPNTNSTANDKSDDYLNFWVPEGYDDNVVIEVDKQIRTWLACMTEIQGGLLGVNARVGGDEYIGEDDEIHNLLYCQLDDYIYGVISETDGVTSSGDPKYKYSAPAINPTSSSDNPSYEKVPLTSVSDYKQHNVISESDYEVTKKVYYVTTAKTDTWMNFTMPFDVEKIWMLEPYSEADIKTKFNEFKAEDKALANEGKLDKNSPNYLSPMERTLMWQAQYNADFAAFFGMAMAIGQHGKDFNDIYKDYYTWAKNHADAGKYTGDYDLRGLYELKHYNGSNFTESHYFLYKNMGDWTLNEYDEVAAARWEVAPAVGADSILMNKGETYSMLFPYCTGCDVELEEKDGEWQVKMDEETGLPVQLERDYWDYWSGKLLIFESTNGDPDPNTQDDNRPHTIKGSNYIAPSKVDSDTPWIFDGISPTSGIGVLTGNSTFSTMSVEDYEEVRDYIFTYDDTPYVETFLPAEVDISGKLIYETLVPTESFLIAQYHKPVKLITRNGRVVTEGSEDQGNDNSGTTTGGHMPTVGGGHSMFITGFDGGINVAVATPQQVRVISATGTILYSGYVNDNVDIPLPINGIYIVKGETEVQKIFY